ncbi:MAG: tyrosine-type recombinase/integrase [Bacteroidota bacterium]
MTHDGRRSCSTLLHDKGADLRTIQYVNGHSDTRMTEKYIEKGSYKKTLDGLKNVDW